jgi:hypothetical protein
VFISVVSATFWPLGHALDSVKLPAHGLTLGPLLLVNLGLTTVFVGALMLLVMISGGIGRRRAAGHRLVMASLLLTVAALGAVAALTGADPLMHWLGQLG